MPADYLSRQTRPQEESQGQEPQGDQDEEIHNTSIGLRHRVFSGNGVQLPGQQLVDPRKAKFLTDFFSRNKWETQGKMVEELDIMGCNKIFNIHFLKSKHSAKSSGRSRRMKRVRARVTKTRDRMNYKRMNRMGRQPRP